MADSAVAPLPLSGALVGTELFYADNGVLDVRVTANLIKTFTGDVHGPASAADNAIARFDGTTGKLLQNSAVFVSDGGGLVVGDPTLEGSFWNGTLGLQSTGLNSNQIGLGLSAFGAGYYPIIEMAASRGSSIHTQTILQADDTIASLVFSGSDGNAFQEAAGIEVVVDGTPGSGDMPGRIIFKTTPDGSVGAVERMRIGNDGQVFVGEMLNVGNGPGPFQPVAPSAGGTHWPLELWYVYSNAQLEGSAFDFAAGIGSFIYGHKTSGSMGQFNALIANTYMEVDAGATVRAVQAAHMTAYAFGDGTLSAGIQGFQLETTIELDDTIGLINGYASAMEVYVNVNTTSKCDYVWGFVAQAYTDAAAEIIEFYAAAINLNIDNDGSAVDGFCLRLNSNLYGDATNIYLLHAPTPDLDAGRAITNHWGLWVGDQSSVASSISENIRSVGVNSKNVFEGITNVGAVDGSFLGFPTKFTVNADPNVFWTTRFAVFGNNIYGASFQFTKTRHASDLNDTSVPVADNDDVLDIRAWAAAGSNFVSIAEIRAQVDGTVASLDVPGRLVFKVAPTGVGVAQERMRLDGNATAGNTAMMLWDVDNGTLERVTVGAANSGGSGFKVLRIPN